MITAEQIPDEVVEAAAKADHDTWRKINDIVEDTCEWEELAEVERVDRRLEARAAIAAALAAWPGAKNEPLSNWVMDGPGIPYVEERPALILPLSTEARDD